MTPREAKGWLAAAATWVCTATPGEGSSYLLKWFAGGIACSYWLGEHHKALAAARHHLAISKAAAASDERQLRLLLIFIRRLTKHVGGWVPPKCGRCSDTGVIHHRHHRDVWPVACWRCRPEEHGRQMCRRVSAWMAAHGRPSLTQEGENGENAG